MWNPVRAAQCKGFGALASWRKESRPRSMPER
jgi:hypothetical protein